MKINLSGQSFESFEAHKSQFQLNHNNSGPVRCRDCKRSIPAGKGIFRVAYKRSGYLCFTCFAKDLTFLTNDIILGDTGFFIDSLGRLRACSFSRYTVSTPEVIEAVFRSLLDEAYTSIDILLGDEGAHIWKISDAAEASIGR